MKKIISVVLTTGLLLGTMSIGAMAQGRDGDKDQLYPKQHHKIEAPQQRTQGNEPGHHIVPQPARPHRQPVPAPAPHKPMPKPHPHLQPAPKRPVRPIHPKKPLKKGIHVEVNLNN